MKIKRFLMLCLGWIFLVVGIAGLVLPVIQGVLCIAIGLFLLSRESPYIKEKLHKFNEKARMRFPKFHKEFCKVKVKAEQFVEKITGKK